MPGNFRLVQCEAGFIITLFLSTFAVAVFCNDLVLNLTTFSYLTGWSALATAAGFTVLDGTKWLDSFRPRPSRTDLLTLYLTLLLPYMMFKYLFLLLTGLTIIRQREIFIGLSFITLCAWTYRYVAGVWFEKSGEKRLIWLLLDGAETVEFTAELNRQGLKRFYDLRGRSGKADVVVISPLGLGKFEGSEDILLAHLNGVAVRDVRHLLTELRGKESLEFLSLWFFLITATPQSRLFRFFFKLKSITEPILAAVLLFFLSPIIGAAALAVKFTSPGPVLFRQKRLGYKGKEFELVKFRSMVQHAEKDGPAWAGQQLSKITPVGNFLRRSHIDEIPQLWNVLQGEMSFVGPRPERPEYYSLMKDDIPLFWVRTLVRPGITGWAQVIGGYASSVEESRSKLEYDLYYMKRMSPILDLKILVKTLLMFLSARDNRAL